MPRRIIPDDGGRAHDEIPPVLDFGPALRRIFQELAEHRRELHRVAERGASPVGLLSRNQAAKFLDCSTARLGALIKSGDVPVVRFDGRPRFRVEDLAAFAARHLSDEGGEA
jgi:hypothetical protein